LSNLIPHSACLVASDPSPPNAYLDCLTLRIVSGGGCKPGAGADIMSDSGPKTPICPPITPPARKKRLFSGFRSPKYALLTPLWPPKAPENHPFCAHFRAHFVGQSARIYPARHLSLVSGQLAVVSGPPSSFTLHTSSFTLPPPAPSPCFSRSSLVTCQWSVVSNQRSAGSLQLS
jgi:hypothetical protein